MAATGATSWRRRIDPLFAGGTAAASLLLLGAFALLLVMVLQGSAATWRSEGLGFLTHNVWDTTPGEEHFGALAYIWGTFASSVIALVLAVPVAIGTAIALATLLPRWLSAPVGLLVELLAAVPSIVFGVWGLNNVVPLVADLAHGHSYGRSMLAAGIVLACMILPIITAIARDMLKAVPVAQRDAALALGATQWEVTWKVQLPYARGGLIAATILGFGRAIGETMAVILVIGTVPTVPRGLFGINVFAPGYTLASKIANSWGEAGVGPQRPALIGLGLLMLVMSLVLSIIARIVVRRMERRAGA